MASRAVTFRKADMARAISVFEAKGLAVGGCEIARDGTIRILTTAAVLPVDEEEAELAAYRARRDARGAA